MKELDDIIKKLDKDIADTEARIAEIQERIKKNRKRIFILDCFIAVCLVIFVLSIIGLVLK